MNDDITMAQVKTGEDAVVERLRQKGLLPRENGVWTIDQRQHLEHSLAAAFVTLQRERVPERRQELWGECLRLAGELEKLSNGS